MVRLVSTTGPEEHLTFAFTLHDLSQIRAWVDATQGADNEPDINAPLPPVALQLLRLIGGRR